MEDVLRKFLSSQLRSQKQKNARGTGRKDHARRGFIALITKDAHM
jgi:hypothetical protein